MHNVSPLYANSTEQEKSLFHSFRVGTSNRVAGTFEGNFWSVDVLQACEMHPASWYSALAIAAMQIRKQGTSSSDGSQASEEKYDHLALKHYNKAIGHLVRATQQTSPSFEDQALILMATVLLLGFASLRGQFNEAKFFAGHALRLFTKWNFREAAGIWKASGRSSAISVTALVVLLDNLRIQYSWVARAEAPIDIGGTTITLPSKTCFTSMSEAYYELQSLQTGLLEVVHAHARSSSSANLSAFWNTRRAWLYKLSDWKDKFLQIRRLCPQELENPRPELVLQMGLISLQLVSQLHRVTDELSWDQFTSKFSRIVDIADQLLDAERALNDTEEPSSPVFCFAPSPLGILYMAASNCRDYDIRRRAVSLLKDWQQRDGMLDSGLLASLAEAKIRIEESGAEVVDFAQPERCECVPRQYICKYHRVMETGVEFLANGLAKLSITSPAGRTTEPTTQSVIVLWNG